MTDHPMSYTRVLEQSRPTKGEHDMDGACPSCESTNAQTHVHQGPGTLHGMEVHLVDMGWKCADCGFEWGFQGELPCHDKEAGASAQSSALVYLAQLGFEVEVEGNWVAASSDGLVWCGSLGQVTEFAARLRASNER